MNITLEQKKDKVFLTVAFQFRGKRGETKVFTDSNALHWIASKHPQIKLGKLLSRPSKGTNNIDRLNGTWIFELYKEKPIDILKDNVKINTIKIEAESPTKEQKNEASLPNGLKKITKTKRKRATKKKTTEE